MVFDRIKEIVVEQLVLDNADDIKMGTSMIDDLDADSLDAVEVIMAIEDEFDIEIEDEDAEGFKSIGDIVNYVNSKISA
ncbi:MAG: acyl carrier protein [Peptostreptococcaceae bacterium]|nr:acyl carrier protein [Peptostreptococcaceae bacterium]